MSEEMKFFMYLMESYAAYKGMYTGDVVKTLEEKSLLETVYKDWWGYHTEALKNAFMDIDSLIATGKHAW